MDPRSIPRGAPVTPVPEDDYWVEGSGLPALDGLVECSVIWNGSLVVGGQFTQVGGVPANNIALWNGSKWMPLGMGLNEEVMSLLVFDGSLVASGRFTGSGAIEASGVAVWNGTSWQPMGNGFDVVDYYLPMVAALSLYQGELIAAGHFSKSGSVPADCIARWNGISWQPLGDGVNGPIWALATHGDSLYVGGAFDSAGTEHATGFARWNGEIWSAPPGVLTSNGGPGSIHSLRVFQGHLVAGGEFDTAGGVPAHNVARWDGEGWSSMAAGFNARVTCIAVHEDILYAGTYFGSQGVRAWDGSGWAEVASMEYGYALTLLSFGGDLVVGGAFRANSTPYTIAGFNIARWTGSQWFGFETWTDTMHGLSSLFGGSPHVQSICVYRGKLTAGGFIGLAGDPPGWVESGTITAWDGSRWNDLLPPSYVGQAYALLPDGDTLYAAGSLISPDTYTYRNTPVLRFNGTTWSPMDTLSATGTCVAWYQGSLHLGAFSSGSPGPQRGGLYRWSGKNWEPLGETEPMSGVTSMVEHDGKLIVGGTFEEIGGILARNIAAWDGSTWAPLGGGLEAGWSGVWGLTEWDGRLIAGGQFYLGPSASPVVVWDGTWKPLGVLEGTAYSLREVDGRLFAGGWFESLARQNVKGLIEWDGSAWAPLGSSVNGPVYSIERDGNSLIAGGSFTLAGVKSSFGVAEWRGLKPAPQEAPRVPLLSANRPNPFSGTTRLSLTLPHEGVVRVSIHDLAGREVTLLEHGHRQAGTLVLTWDGRAANRSVGSGMFFVRAELPDGTILTRKVLHVR